MTDLGPLAWVKANGLEDAIRRIVDRSPMEGPPEALALIRAHNFPVRRKFVVVGECVEGGPNTARDVSPATRNWGVAS